MIRSREVRVISSDGEQLGVLAVRDAIARAEELGLDLVEVAPNAVPPQNLTVRRTPIDQPQGPPHM